MSKYENLIGKLLDNKYKILDVVGSGGMAVVLKAEDINMKRLVAIKILNEEYTGNEQAEKRFANEAKAVAMLSHRNIVSIYDIAMYPDMKYIVMEFLDGITLREYLDNKGALPWKEACIYTLQMLRALEHAHSKGVIHRDIKPQNVVLLKSGEIKVTDFGIAKTPTSHSLTLTQKAIGTVYYISPEQACGKPTSYASDLYSLGVLFYEAVTGTLPFTGDNSVQIAMMQVNNDPVDPKQLVPSLPVGVKQIILKAMQKDPAKRFSSAHSMAKAIEWLLRNPEVVFADGNELQDESEPVATSTVSVSIDMINTSDIEPYGQTEIVESISGQKPKKKKKEKKPKAAKEKQPKRSKSRSMFPIISGVTFAFIAVAVVIGVLAAVQVFTDIFTTGDVISATYPDIVGSTWNSQLESQLQNGKFGAKFKVDNIVYVQNDGFESGQITNTEPTAGHYSERSVGEADMYFHFTTITICRKNNETLVPDVRFLKSNEARLLLAGDEYRYNVTIRNEDNNDFFDGQVIRTEPSHGQELKYGSDIILFVCSHNASQSKTAALPKLTDLNIEEARTRAGYALYTVEVVYEQREDFAAGTVIAQSIEPGVISEAGTLVTLTVAQEITGYTAESYIGMSYLEVTEKLAGMNMTMADCCFFYIRGDDNVYPVLMNLDYESAKLQMTSSNYASAPQTVNAVVKYQSIKSGSTITRDDKIYIIFGVEP